MVDMGILRVEVIGAKNLMAGDRSGKSDVSPTFLGLKGQKGWRNDEVKEEADQIALCLFQS